MAISIKALKKVRKSKKLSNMSVHHETYARAAKDKRPESLYTRCNEQVNEIQSKINDLKINNPAAYSRLKSLD
jgi:hypothetical protein